MLVIPSFSSILSTTVTPSANKPFDKFTNKAYMQKGETWTIDGKTYDFNQVNQKI